MMDVIYNSVLQLKTHPDTGKSKGYGFIKFADYEVQKRVTSKKHQIGGRWCDVKIPYSKACTIHHFLYLSLLALKQIILV